MDQHIRDVAVDAGAVASIERRARRLSVDR